MSNYRIMPRKGYWLWVWQWPNLRIGASFEKWVWHIHLGPFDLTRMPPVPHDDW